MKNQKQRLSLLDLQMLAFGRIKTEKDAKKFASFYRSVQKGDANQVKSLLKQGMDPNWRFCQESMLSLAARRKKAASVKALLDGGANPNIDRGGPVVLAASRGDIEVVRALVKAGANVNLRGPGDFPPLTSACFRGRAELIRLLISAGADLNKRCEVRLTGVRGTTNATPLIIAVWQGYLDVVKLLLKAGAKPTMTDSSGRSALYWARASRKPVAGKILSLLVESCAAKDRRAGKSIPLQPDFSSMSRGREFREVVSQLKKTFHRSPVQLRASNGEIIDGGVLFALTEAEALAFVDKNQQRLIEKGSFIFRTSQHSDASATAVGVLPTTDQFEAVAAMQTDGANYGIYNEDIIRHLKGLFAKQPFVLIGIGFDFVEGRFLKAIKYSKGVAKRLINLCPDMGKPGAIAEQLERSGVFLLWWD